MNWDLVPSIVYTQPGAGLGRRKPSEQLKAAAVAYKVAASIPSPPIRAAAPTGTTEGFVKVLATTRAPTRCWACDIIGKAEAGTW